MCAAASRKDRKGSKGRQGRKGRRGQEPKTVRTLPAHLVRPDFPAELPITPRIGEIVDLLRRHQAIIVAGETGSGKTTQLPKACLAAGLGRHGAIAHTQPRRLAARTVAARIATELGVELGREVGYAVRFADRVSPATVVKVMTDGLLLNDIQRDRLLRQYDCVIVDEAHERSLNIDFILGCLKQLLPRRPDLKVVVTSATIDVDAFAKHFNGAPVVEVTGRGYPVEIVYFPPTASAAGGRRTADKGKPRSDNQYPASASDLLIDCLNTIAKDSPVGRRDVLVFQSGEREIFENAQLLRKTFRDRFDILPLYARLPFTEQQRVFAPGGRQRVVLATNVAETSITVPNIGYVVDPGLARMSRYSYRAKLQRLPVEAISQASAEQRAGRCGRIAPGVCYRLYEEDDFNARPAYTDPELKRTNLASVVLAMRAFRLGDISTFPFIDPPDARAVRDAIRLLAELQALEDDALTETGRIMARLPVDPRLARMLVEAARTGAAAEMLVVVAALAAQDPRLRPLDRREAADRAHALFAETGADKADQTARQTARSDFLAFIKLWRWIEHVRAENTRSAFQRLLEKHFLSPPRVREWHALHRQLLLACKELGMQVNTQPADYATLHRALIAGSLGFVGQRRDPAEHGGEQGIGKRKRSRWTDYDGARGLRFRLFPGSTLSRASPPWVVAAEISDTGDTFARCVAAVEPEWIEQSARHIAKSTFSAPRWDAARGEAIVDERVTVYGLTVVAQRPRRAALVDMAAAREIFVREALVRRRGKEGKRIDAEFLVHNERLIRRVEERQARGRRADLLASETTRARFYLARLPEHVCSVATWQRYARGVGAAGLARFEMAEQDVLARADGQFGADDFPTRLRCGEVEVSLGYKFAPGEPDDGVTARVDLGQLAQLDADALDWLVPGFFEQKCVALVRGLPKAIRRQLAPAPDRVAAILPKLHAPRTYRCGKLLPAISNAIRAAFGVTVPVSEWRVEALAPHLRMNVQVRGERRRVVDQDRDVDALRSRLLAKVESVIAGDWRAQHERLAMLTFPEQGVPATLPVQTPAGRAVVYPVLVDRGSSVDLLIHPTPAAQATQNRAGYARLALLAEPRSVRQLLREVERDSAFALRYAPLGSATELADSLLMAAAWFAYFEGRDLPTTRPAFDARLTAGKLAPVCAEVLHQARAILTKRFEVASAVQGLESPAFAASRADLEEQLGHLVGARFLNSTPRHRLADLPRYLDGMAYRIDKLRGRVQRDQAGMDAVRPWLARLAALRDAGVTEQVDELRFAIEEFRIATFSQRVGTRGKISAKRLHERFQAVEAAAEL